MQLRPPYGKIAGRPIPDRLEDLGVPRSVVADLVLRYLWLHGSGTLARLNETLKLSFPVLETLFHQFRNQQLLEVKGMTGNDYSFSLTAGGRAQASRAQRGLPVCGTGAGIDPAISESSQGAGGARAVEPGKPAAGVRRPGAAGRAAGSAWARR